MKTNFCAEAQTLDSQNCVACDLEGSVPWAGVDLGLSSQQVLATLLPLSSLGAIPAPCGRFRRTAVTGHPSVIITVAKLDPKQRLCV